MNGQRKKYNPDLRSFMALCATNYAKLIKLLPDIERIEELGPVVQFQVKKQPDLEVQLLQVSRYTQTLSLKQADVKQHLNREFCVRIYHDAKLVEVLSGVHDPMLPPVYKIPNQAMKQVDEKAQINRFLGEWLSFCLEHGQIDTQYRTQLAFLS
ncbi:MAG: DUF1249 domain-containing protein [Gammaproteobacteria bacterium]|nr:DUF1249 domain-containing protein [Gammaproteobacteria bacterium]